MGELRVGLWQILLKNFDISSGDSNVQKLFTLYYITLHYSSTHTNDLLISQLLISTRIDSS